MKRQWVHYAVSTFFVIVEDRFIVEDGRLKQLEKPAFRIIGRYTDETRAKAEARALADTGVHCSVIEAPTVWDSSLKSL